MLLSHDAVVNVSFYLQNVRNPCVTPIIVPDGVAWKDVADYAMKK